ncbi:MAG TPA: hypothetical protein VN578_03430 [Candidatus Binatia bacterium]|jgi:hypothetical protein|nr:hypothetical protein [Candidatus Binatia bacterium]
MAVADKQKSSLRLERAESLHLALALAISLACHGVVGGGYYLGKRLNWWDVAHWPAWLQKARILAQVFQKKAPPPAPQPQEVPLVFLEVSPAQAATEPPKEAKFYSDKNSRAANPDADKETDIPKITGTQQEMAKTENVPRPKFSPLQPTAPADQAPKEQEEMKAKPALEPGDLTLTKPDPTPKKDEGEAPHARPRTIQEARARMPDEHLAGQKMKQEGGVRHRLELASLDAKATAFGAYDYSLIEAIQQCWYNLLDAQQYASDYRGKVVLQFRLHQDGRISDLTVTENTAGSVPGWICRTAVDKPNPYRPFPGDMRRVVGETRDIQFTFFYN